MHKISIIMIGLVMLSGCGGSTGQAASGESESESAAVAAPGTEVMDMSFDADSAYSYVAKQVSFGPRVPGSEAHANTAAWLESELRRHGAEVTLQKAKLKAFDGTELPMTNIMGSYKPEKSDRLLLLAHYDTRPWADQDATAANRKKAIDGANDGASGVGVLLETARMLGERQPDKGIDILFVDCEDYGTEGDDESWALGARYFAEHPIKPGYRPARAILLDMVGGVGAEFPAEYMSRSSAPEIDDAIRAAAARAGHSSKFPRKIGGAITDDHVELIKAGIPAIDIIDYRGGFCPTWHTMEDNMDNIDKETLKAVGETLFEYLKSN